MEAGGIVKIPRRLIHHSAMMYSIGSPGQPLDNVQGNRSSGRRRNVGVKWKPLLLAFVCAVVIAEAAAAAVQKTNPDLTAPDGLKLKASYYSGESAGPGILLLHMCGGATRDSWDNLAMMLANKGFHVLTLDYRGFGESEGTRFDALTVDGRRSDQAKWPGDIDIAYKYLLAQHGVDSQRIGAGGASCGVGNSLQLAMRRPEVKALVFLSGGATREGLEYIRNTPWVSLFLAASENDTGFVPYMKWLSQFSQNPRNMLKLYKDAGHGTDMFAVEKELEPAIVEYFSDVLNSKATPDSNPPAADASQNPQLAFWSTLTGPDGAAKALQELQNARKRDPKIVLMPELAWVLLGNDYTRAGNASEAARVLQVALQEYPTSIDIHYGLVSAYVDAGDRTKALEYRSKAELLVEKDTTMSSEEKEQVRKLLEQRMQKLERKP